MKAKNQVGSSSWFKFYSSAFRSHPVLKRMPVLHRFAYVLLLCLASEGKVKGQIALDFEQGIVTLLAQDREIGG